MYLTRMQSLDRRIMDWKEAVGGGGQTRAHNLSMWFLRSPPDAKVESQWWHADRSLDTLLVGGTGQRLSRPHPWLQWHQKAAIWPTCNDQVLIQAMCGVSMHWGRGLKPKWSDRWWWSWGATAIMLLATSNRLPTSPSCCSCCCCCVHHCWRRCPHQQPKTLYIFALHLLMLMPLPVALHLLVQAATAGEYASCHTSKLLRLMAFSCFFVPFWLNFEAWANNSDNVVVEHRQGEI